jgi:hypothetical protein
MIRYYESRPDLFKKASKMKRINYQDPTLNFPINIPIKHYYIYRPLPAHKRERSRMHDFIDFK